MNILYINHYAGSPNSLGMEFRPYYFARDWKNKGHNVLILAATYSHLRSKQPTNANGSVFTKITVQNVEGVDYRWYPTPEYKVNGVQRMINISSFLLRVFLDSQTLVKKFKPDIVIASSTYPMDIWVAKHIVNLVKKYNKKNCKLIFEVHDLWPLSPIELGGMSPKHPFIKLCQSSENFAYRNCDKVVSMACKAEPYMKEHGLTAGKFTYIPNGVVENDWKLDKIQLLHQSDLLTKLLGFKRQNKIIIGYAGAHGKPNALNYLIDAIKLLEERKYPNFEDLVFVLVGSGLEKENLIKQSKNLKSIHFFDPISKLQIPNLLSYFDIAYIGWNITPIYRFGISPNKLMDYMMSGRPILHSVEAGNDPVQESQCGITVPPENIEAIVQGIQILASLTSKERDEMGARGKKFILENQTYEILSNKFIKVMQQ